ncbi:KpsF/GutQ family sugar-phosphate isomerase [Pseudomonas sp. NKUCC02_KPG]|nr:KpsF/GutQ family sugar-phosphate isomerase [Pseudomonas sp. NKUCC02_KPG]
MDFIAVAKRVFSIEAQAVALLADRLDNSFADAVERILSSNGRVIVCGMGKSGIIGKKIAATLASTGTPSFFMHPGEAYHGDLGMVTADDIFVAISNSGETDEVLKLIPFLKDNGNYLVAFTGNSTSTLAKAAHSHLDIGVPEEACPLKLAPTSSTTATLAMGDALAVTLMKARDFRPESFARFHPGGSLGRRLLSKVEDEMITSKLPLVSEEAQVLEVIKAISFGSLGLAIVTLTDGWGLVTDGDIRRAIECHGNEVFNKTAADLMTRHPSKVSVGTRIEDAILLMDKHNITSLLVFQDERLVGVFKK